MSTKTKHPSIKRRWKKITKAVSAIKTYLAGKLSKSRKIEIFVLVEDGMVREIVNLPDKFDITIIDYDTDGVANQELDISPVDGELCVVTHW